MSTSLDRTALVASIAADVAYLVEHERECALACTMEATGYLSNSDCHKAADLGAAIVALAAVIDEDWLAALARTARFERVFERTDEEGLEYERRPGRWEAASAASDAVCPEPARWAEDVA